MIDLHALVSQMRIVSSGPVIETAVNVVRVITDTYSQPNKSPEEIEAMVSNGSVDILQQSTDEPANREGLSMLWSSAYGGVVLRIKRAVALTIRLVKHSR